MNKKDAALRQITAAIEHFEAQQYECAITLAGAAEGQIKTDEGSEHLFAKLKVMAPEEFENEREWASWLNTTRDWLKHETPHLGDDWEINAFGAAVMIARAITKFGWAYQQGTKQMQEFIEKCQKSGMYIDRTQQKS